MNRICETCIHKNICKHEKEFKEIQTELDTILFIEPVALQCMNWLKEAESE